MSDITFPATADEKWAPSLNSDLSKEVALIRELLSVSGSIQRMSSEWELVPQLSRMIGRPVPTGVAVYGRPSFYRDCIALVESQLTRLKELMAQREKQDITGVLPASVLSASATEASPAP